MLQGITDKKFRFRVTAIFTMALVLLVANVAYAAWTATGSGTGQATAGEATPLDIWSVAAGTDTLYPTVTGDLEVKVENPNPYNVTVTEIALGTGGVKIDDGATEGGVSALGDCEASSVTFDGPYNFVNANEDSTGSSHFVVEGGDDEDIVLADALTMSNTADDDCQNETFIVHLVLSGESTAASAHVPTP